MNILANLATSTASTSAVLSLLQTSKDNQELIIAFLSSLIVQVIIKLVEYFKKKRRIRRVKRLYGTKSTSAKT